ADQNHLPAGLPDALHLVGQGLQPFGGQRAVGLGQHLGADFDHHGMGQSNDFLTNWIDHGNGNIRSAYIRWAVISSLPPARRGPPRVLSLFPSRNATNRAVRAAEGASWDVWKPIPVAACPGRRETSKRRRARLGPSQ